VWWYCQ